MLYKPNQLVMGSNTKIGVVQRKAYNVILYEARIELMKNEKQTEFYFSIADLKRKAGIKATDNKRLKDSLKELMDITIEVIKDDKDDWKLFKLLSEADKEGELLYIELPRTIRKALLSDEYYTPMDLLDMAKLTGKYSTIIYEVYLRYKGVEIPFLTTEELKKLLGIEKESSYDKNFGMLRKKIIDVALEEIHEKFNVKIIYDIKKRGRTISGIKFRIEKSEVKKKKSDPKKIKEVNPEYLNPDHKEVIKKREKSLEGLRGMKELLKEQGVIK